MKMFIEQEKRRIEKELSLMNEQGSTISMKDSDGTHLFETLAASFMVTRVEPRFDMHGNHRKTDFWLFWKEVGYQESRQAAHTIKVVDVKVDDSYAIDDPDSNTTWLIADLTDDRGRRFHLEVIEPGAQPDKAEFWKEWTGYRSSNRKMFDEIDRDILEEHLNIAGSWR